MELINQPFESKTIGDKLIELLQSNEYESFDFSVAFAKNSGVLQLKSVFEKFRANQGVINAYIGIDLYGTSYEALINLLNITDELHVVHFEGNQTFHPKMYRLKGKTNSVFIIGSSNLTRGGLWTNLESSIVVAGTNQEKHIIDLDCAFTAYLETLSSVGPSCLKICNQDQIDSLLSNNYIAKELDIVISNRDRKQRTNPSKLFSKGVKATSPKNIQEDAPDYSHTRKILDLDQKLHTLQTLWMVSGKMTGGSRNILDLSKKSLLEKGDPTGTEFDMGDAKFIRGAVEFFGLNPMEESKEKNITLNFRGVDYEGNRIFYPIGEKANGTWRIRIGGFDANKKEITSTFKELSQGSDLFLVNKILAFSRVSDGYYYLSVFELSKLEDFLAASCILARNGQNRNARRIGLLKNG